LLTVLNVFVLNNTFLNQSTTVILLLLVLSHKAEASSNSGRRCSALTRRTLLVAYAGCC